MRTLKLSGTVRALCALLLYKCSEPVKITVWLEVRNTDGILLINMVQLVASHALLHVYLV